MDEHTNDVVGGGGVSGIHEGEGGEGRVRWRFGLYCCENMAVVN